MKWKCRLLWLVLSSMMLTACAPEQDGAKVDLKPNDLRPIFSITVADHTEVEILQQQLKLEPIYIRDTTLYFYEAPDLVERLKETGYVPQKRDPYQVFERVVRIQRKGGEQELLKTGVQLINREKNYWIVRGNLAQLTVLERIGYRLTRIDPHEPRPREIKVTVNSLDEVRWIYAQHVDVYTVKETKAGYVVYGGAFDHQIDRLRERDLKVELIDTVGKGAQP